MSEIIKISIADEALRAALGRVIASLRDTTPVMRALSEIMLDASARAFQDNADPATGAPWKPLSASRQRQRAKKDRSIANMLQDSGLLVGSTARPPGQGAVREIGPDHALVGTNVPYAAAHQFGAVIRREAAPMTVRLRKWKGRIEFAKAKHKRVRIVDTIRRAHAVTIPARPFIGVGPTDIEAMLETIARHIKKAYAAQ